MTQAGFRGEKSGPPGRWSGELGGNAATPQSKSSNPFHAPHPINRGSSPPYAWHILNLGTSKTTQRLRSPRFHAGLDLPAELRLPVPKPLSPSSPPSRGHHLPSPTPPLSSWEEGLPPCPPPLSHHPGRRSRPQCPFPALHAMPWVRHLPLAWMSQQQADRCACLDPPPPDQLPAAQVKHVARPWLLPLTVHIQTGSTSCWL